MRAQDGLENGAGPDPPVDKLMTFLLFIFPALGGLLFGQLPLFSNAKNHETDGSVLEEPV